MSKLSLTVDLVNGILQYLGTRPYVEVINIINELQKQASEQAGAPTEPTQEDPTIIAGE